MTIVPTKTRAPRFNLDYRPASYFDRPRTPESLILGESRRQLVKRYKKAGIPFDARLMKPKLTDDELGQLQRIHPSLCGGEDLPEVAGDEVEIVRIHFPTNIHGEVTSIRARQERSEIGYRIVDEYESSIVFSPATSLTPLTMGELMSMIDGAEDGLAPPAVGGLVARWGWRSESQEIEPADMVGDVVVSSEFYPSLGEYYEWRFEEWLRQRRRGRP